MKTFSPREISILLKLAVPLVLTGVLEASVGFFSTLFLAHLGPHELAAGAVVQWLFFTMMVVLWGTLTSMSVLVSQKHGAQDVKGISLVLRDGLLLAFILFIPAFIILRNISPVLLLTGQDQTIVTLAKEYMDGLSWGMLPDFVGLVLMQFLIGLGHTRTNMFFTMLWIPLNIFCNYALIFGKFGFPALGMAGIGWGATLAFWISTVLLFLFLLLKTIYRPYLEAVLQWSKPRYLLELLQVGLPMGSMFCIEIGFFLTLTLLMGRIGSQELGANQITLQFLGQLSVVTFGIAGAITVRMGHTLGANEPRLAERAAYIGVSMAVLFMFFVACLYWFIPTVLIGVDLDTQLAKNAEVVAYAKQFLAIGAVFQMLESARLTLFGALRSLKDTRFTLLTSIISFWCISLPIGYFLATRMQWGGMGLWCGMIIGAVIGVILLMLRFRYKMRRANVLPERSDGCL